MVAEEDMYILGRVKEESLCTFFYEFYLFIERGHIRERQWEKERERES